MNDEYDADREPTEPIQAAPLWAPPASGEERPPAVAPDPRPEPTTPLPLAPSLMPPPPTAPPTPESLSLKRPTFGSGNSSDADPTDPSAQPVPLHGGGHSSHRPRRLWPAVALLSLLVGLGGGFLGALGYDTLFADDSGPGYSDGGLNDVDLEELPPLEKPGSVAAVAQAILPSTVQIIAEFEGQAGGATGSGFVMDKNGHIITNNHVVASAAKGDGPIVVVDHDRNRYEATVVGLSAVYDLAVLQVKDFEGLVPAKLGYSKRLRVGEPVVAVGSPLSLPDTVTSGIVSYMQRPVTTGSSADESSFINAVQTDAAINPGNSGGPLVNMQGEVIGVNSAIATAGGGSVDQEAGNIGVGFAIPVEQVRVTADQILKTGKAQYPVIGAKVKTGGIPTGEGAELDEIIADSPARDAGLRKGDLITHINGSRVADGIALIVAIRSYQPGQTVEFTVTRGSNDRKVKVTLNGEEG